jgi:hypothetical protein
MLNVENIKVRGFHRRRKQDATGGEFRCEEKETEKKEQMRGK